MDPQPKNPPIQQNEPNYDDQNFMDFLSSTIESNNSDDTATIPSTSLSSETTSLDLRLLNYIRALQRDYHNYNHQSDNYKTPERPANPLSYRSCWKTPPNLPKSPDSAFVSTTDQNRTPLQDITNERDKVFRPISNTNTPSDTTSSTSQQCQNCPSARNEHIIDIEDLDQCLRLEAAQIRAGHPRSIKDWNDNLKNG